MLSAILIASLLAADAPNAHLAQAERLYSDLKYNDARAELELASEVPNNSRPVVLRILALQGIVAASLKHAKQAEEFFRILLATDPTYKLSEDYAPRVTTPFYEAKSWVSDHGTLGLTALGPELTATGVASVGASVTSDPFTMARKVRFHLRPADGSWGSTDVPLDHGSARAPANEARSVEWWAELLGDYDAQLELLGSEQAPLTARVKPTDAPQLAEVAPAPPVVEPPAPELAPPTQVQKSGGTSVARPIAWVALGLGAIAGGAGAWFGVKSSSDFSTVRNAQREQPVVTSLTQAAADRLNTEGRQDALLANGLFCAAGALGLTAGILFLTSRTDLAVSAGPGGSVEGAF